MAKKDLILVGGGGHCKSCIDVIEAEGTFNIAGIVDVEGKLREKVLDYEIIATDNDLESLATQYQYFLITIGSIKDPRKRIDKFDYLKQLGVTFPVIVSPLAYVAKSACVGEGTIVMHKVLINSDACVRMNCIINTLALIEHDSTVGDHCHISTGSIINGKCNIGNRVFVGSDSVVIDCVNIGDDAVIGAGSVVLKSLSEAGLYVGSPAIKVTDG
ncbi:MAG: acetyltransferase [Candidatus Scalindua sediminis]|nr:acetyltransferase [Candidatus Scalindua sediminis]